MHLTFASNADPKQAYDHKILVQDLHTPDVCKQCGVLFAFSLAMKMRSQKQLAQPVCNKKSPKADMSWLSGE